MLKMKQLHEIQVNKIIKSFDIHNWYTDHVRFIHTLQHSAAIQTSSQSDLPLASVYPQGIADYKAKTLDDTKVHNWGYVPNMRWWPITPANI